MPSLSLPRHAWLAVLRWTAIVTLVSVLISAVASTAILGLLSHGINGPGLAASIIMPIVLGGPTMFYLALGRQRLKHANAQLLVLASTDWLTGCLNRRAFTHQATVALAATAAGPARGALLIIDADHFKAINDRYGHEQGDEALRLIANAIRAATRAGDLVGRLGGEEFGIFLSDTDMEAADAVAEHVRWSVAAIDFSPRGQIHPISVSIGGAMYEGAVAFADLFHIADARLYRIKHSGRNRVDLAEAGEASRSAA